MAADVLLICYKRNIFQRIAQEDNFTESNMIKCAQNVVQNMAVVQINNNIHKIRNIYKQKCFENIKIYFKSVVGVFVMFVN